MKYYHGLASAAGFALLLACSGSSTGIEKPIVYTVTSGACGTLAFAETIGTDSASAFAVVETRKTEQFGADKVALVPYELGVIDQHGNVPEQDFYAIRVENAETGMLVHSVFEVISTKGELFTLHWCPD